MSFLLVLKHLVKAIDWYFVVDAYLLYHLPKAFQALTDVLLNLSFVELVYHACQVLTLCRKYFDIVFEICECLLVLDQIALMSIVELLLCHLEGSKLLSFLFAAFFECTFFPVEHRLFSCQSTPKFASCSWLFFWVWLQAIVVTRLYLKVIHHHKIQLIVYAISVACLFFLFLNSGNFLR